LGIVLFDLDDTLMAFETVSEDAWRLACKQYSESIDSKVSSTKIHEYINDCRSWYWSDPERHRIGRKDILKARREIVKIAFEKHQLGNEEKSNWLADKYSSIQPTLWYIFPKVAQIIDILKQNKIKIGIVTNGTTTSQREKIKRFSLDSLFDFIFIEEEVGFGKPDVRIYETVLEKLGQKENVWMIGDDYVWDIEAAKKAGFKTIWINRNRKTIDDEMKSNIDIMIYSIGELVEKQILNDRFINERKL